MQIQTRKSLKETKPREKQSDNGAKSYGILPKMRLTAGTQKGQIRQRINVGSGLRKMWLQEAPF
jgi:hypothetical protein